jgi:hypothetical protein
MNENYNLEKLKESIKGYTKVDGEHIVCINTSKENYGRINVFHKIERKWRSITAQRAMLAVLGKIDIDDLSMDACHSCDRKNCINPDHLYAGTRKDNVEDIGWARGYSKLQVGGFCCNGHEFKTMDDIYINKKNLQRNCNICRRERARKQDKTKLG